MALVGSLVKETANAPGTSTTINLGGASAPFVTFIQGVGAGSGRGYMLQDGTQWEEGWGTVVDGSPDTLSRDTVLANSAGTTARLNFAGTTNVYSVIPSSKSVAINNGGTVDVGSSAIKTTGTITGIALSSGTGPITCGPITATGGISTATTQNIFAGGSISTPGAISSTAGGKISTTGTIAGGIGTFTGKVTAANGASGTDVVNWSQFASSVLSSVITMPFPDGRKIRTGSSVVSLGGTAEAFVSFGTAFTTPPFVIAVNGDYNAVDGAVQVANINGSGFNVKIDGAASKTCRVNWIAIQ